VNIFPPFAPPSFFPLPFVLLLVVNFYIKRMNILAKSIKGSHSKRLQQLTQQLQHGTEELKFLEVSFYLVSFYLFILSLLDITYTILF
jgi:hypothetical protein